MECKDCIKADVCNQKEIFKKVENACTGVNITKDEGIYKMQLVRSNFGISIDVSCNKYVPKNTHYDY